MIDDIECPYCGTAQEVCQYDGEHCEDGKEESMECVECEKSFMVTASISYEFFPRKADCLNDGNHDYRPTTTYPKSFTGMRCSVCKDRRTLTDEERKEYGEQLIGQIREQSN